jgi:hypothetical protein
MIHLLEETQIASLEEHGREDVKLMVEESR